MKGEKILLPVRAEDVNWEDVSPLREEKSLKRMLNE